VVVRPSQPPVDVLSPSWSIETKDCGTLLLTGVGRDDHVDVAPATTGRTSDDCRDDDPRQVT
jgi:hypothetical protein